jgi:hypothetical protein
MIMTDVTKAVGRTPLVSLDRVAKGLPGRIAAKLEMQNPCGSVKDRLGVALIEDAERRGVLRPGTTLIEATGGNTGIGLACAAAVRGYRLVLTLPESMSVERVALLRHLGAEVKLTPGILMGDAVARARLRMHAPACTRRRHSGGHFIGRRAACGTRNRLARGIGGQTDRRAAGRHGRTVHHHRTVQPGRKLMRHEGDAALFTARRGLFSCRDCS